MNEAVLDAGPLIHLGQLEALDALSDFEPLWVPTAVWQEVQQHQLSALTVPGLSLRQVSVSVGSPDHPRADSLTQVCGFFVKIRF